MTLRKSQVNLLTIRQFTNACQTTPRTLRFYDQKGILKPYKTGLWNRYRYYHPDQVLEFTKIRLLQKFNLSIEEIDRFQDKSAVEFLNEELKNIGDQIFEAKKKYLFLNKVFLFLWSKSRLNLDTKTIGPFNLFCFYIEKGKYSDISNYIHILWQEAIKLGLKCEKREVLFYLDPYFKPKDTKIEVTLFCKSTPNLEQKLPENFYFRTLSKTKAYYYPYKGPYDFLPLIYQRLDYHFLVNRISINSPVFEIYENGPHNCRSQYDFLTKIYYPVKSSS